jgi:hypothetical protein
MDLVNDLRAMTASRPVTKSGQVRWLLPEIEAAVRAGHRLKEICAVLNERGLTISYGDFRTVLYRIRRRGKPTAPPRAATPSPAGSVLDEIQQQREKRERMGFRHNPFASDRDLV